jgi:MerR family transcriptional regulator/heat shock protein HspR
MLRRDRDEPLYVIGVVSRMLRVHPQTLRMYEREGLVRPVRQGGQRLYSERDIERIDMVLRLTRDLGVNRAAVEIILRMRERLALLEREVQEMLMAMDSPVRDEFEDKLRRIFSEED